MSESTKKAWQQEPFVVQVKKGETKCYCMCGLSKNPPFCDGAHKHISEPHHAVPMVVHHDQDETLYLCGCKKSKNLPFCDGSHKK
ncbi:MAG: CDGSH iron-sulfur domain-containing protein [Mariprofundaceae bacterium]